MQRIFCLKWAKLLYNRSRPNKGLLADSNGRGGKALHSLCDSSWSLPILCYALRDEERREYLQKVMDQVLVKHRAYCRSYIDDVAVFSKTWEQHMKHLCVVFQTIQKVGLAINRTDKEPSSEYNPLNEVAEQAFTKLKAQLVKAPSLYTPDLSKPYQLYTDASATAIGACLSQNDEKGKENPIAFFSKKLTETQTRWATIEREAYAVIEALKRFDSWIFGAEIEVISDHNPLTYLTLTTPQSAKLTRWALALQRYNIAISYRKGVKHGNADALSRLPIPVS
ncbi:retrovirus-related Pol polyprotein from transposon opus [Trichonephila clavipes]|nr:retrovirus-related Pol polyprotein from transposon opus [Trichonephila clavipes]